MEINMIVHPFNYDHNSRRKSRISSRSSLRDVRDQERYYQSKSADQFDEQPNFNQKHLILKHEVSSNYDDDDEKVEDELAEDLRKSGTPVDD
jgi:hypothetical protein